jgi:hypothetical protein
LNENFNSNEKENQNILRKIVFDLKEKVKFLNEKKEYYKSKVL